MVQTIISVFFILFGVLGAVFFILGLRIKIREITAKRFFSPAEGTVFNNKRTTSTSMSSPVLREDDGHVRQLHEGTTSVFYHPMIEYFVDSKRYTLTMRASSGNEIPVGKKFEILYNPQKPAEAVVKGGNESHGLMIIGVFFIFIPFFYFSFFRNFMG